MLVNGVRSDKLAVTRSVRQGCSLSPALYVIYIESLHELPREDDRIMGLKVGPAVELRSTAFADDMRVVIPPTTQQLEMLKEDLATFCRQGAAPSLQAYQERAMECLEDCPAGVCEDAEKEEAFDVKPQISLDPLEAELRAQEEKLRQQALAVEALKAELKRKEAATKKEARRKLLIADVEKIRTSGPKMKSHPVRHPTMEDQQQDWCNMQLHQESMDSDIHGEEKDKQVHWCGYPLHYREPCVGLGREAEQMHRHLRGDPVHVKDGPLEAAERSISSGPEERCGPPEVAGRLGPVGWDCSRGPWRPAWRRDPSGFSECPRPMRKAEPSRPVGIYSQWEAAETLGSTGWGCSRGRQEGQQYGPLAGRGSSAGWGHARGGRWAGRKPWRGRGRNIDRKGLFPLGCRGTSIWRNEETTFTRDEWEVNEPLQKDEATALRSIYGEDFSVIRTGDDGECAEHFEVMIHVAIPEGGLCLVTEFPGPPSATGSSSSALSSESLPSKSTPFPSKSARDEDTATLSLGTADENTGTSCQGPLIRAADGVGSRIVDSSTEGCQNLEDKEGRTWADSSSVRSCGGADASSSSSVHEQHVIMDSSHLPETYRKTFPLEHLPPLRLFFTLSRSYPSRSAPSFTLSCSWLDDDQLSRLCKELDKIWIGRVGEVTVFEWVSWIERECLSFLGLAEAIVLRPRKEVPNKDERAKAECGILERDVAKLLTYNEERKLDTFRRGLQQCDICYKEHPGTDFLRLSCGHFFCWACMRQYATALVDEGMVTRLLCPGCKESIPYPIIKELLDERHFRRWEEVLLQRTLDSMEDLVYCPRCGTACLEADDHLAQCQNCFFSFCGLCKGPWHWANPCSSPTSKLAVLQATTRGKQASEDQLRKQQAQVNEQLNLKYLQEAAKKCPTCKMAIEKLEGCNKMTCTNCRSCFCYRCGKKINGYEHFREQCILFDIPQGVFFDNPPGVLVDIPRNVQLEYGRQLMNAWDGWMVGGGDGEMGGREG
ncbi:hypothetical protein CBR_g40898 [Chara braunii]|uniref:RBR-type E3 ubiquitin transferase n=1 Tax=Chara braunii TaxID=69332 RepID=A0A388K2C3_CHABU|nr:hypothetical protein CBR_g40898 [Chara braunii]|eukprot:GBG64198.1 hypothetical protein CBR_g40898 [Chara braunii]